MGLNSWNLDGFPETTGQTEVTLESLGLDKGGTPATPPVQIENKPGAPEAIVNVDMENEGGTERTLNDSEIEQIPNWAVKINLITEKSNKVVDMLDIRKDVEGSEEMSQPQAELINATFEGFICSARPMAGFTRMSSPVGYQSTKRFIDQQLKVTVESLQDELEEFKSTHAPELRTATIALNDDGVYDAFCVIRKACEGMAKYATFFQGKTVILPLVEGAMFNMLAESLMTLDADKIDQRVPFSAAGRENLTALQSLWSSSDLLRNILAAGTRVVSEYKNEICAHAVASGMDLTVDDLLKMFAEDRADELYERMMAYTEGLKERSEEAMSNLAAKNEDPFKEANMIQTQAKAVSNAASETLKATAAIRDVAKFASAAHCFVEALANV